MSYFTLGYSVYSAAALSVRTDLQIHGVRNMTDGTFMASHFPLPSNGSTLHSVVRTRANADQWAHVATRFSASGDALHHVYHRLASAEDLGSPNTGSTHHLRVQQATVASPKNNSTIMARDDSSNSHGVVGEYLWEDNDKSTWQDIHNACEGTYENQCDLGSVLANDFETNNIEAGCAVPSITKGSGSYVGTDKAVFAYGWNNSPFQFKGRLGGWLNQCGGPARSCSPE
jgi:hypothetical protein